MNFDNTMQENNTLENYDFILFWREAKKQKRPRHHDEAVSTEYK